MTTDSQTMIRAHVPMFLDYLGLATGIALVVYASQTISDDFASPVFAIVYASLVLGHFLVPIPRRSPTLYGVLLLIGIVSTIFYALDILHHECGYQVIIGRPRDIHTPNVPKDPDSPLPSEPFLNCKTVAGAWWLNLILTYAVIMEPALIEARMVAFDSQRLRLRSRLLKIGYGMFAMWRGGRKF